ncbi:MAG: transposase [Bacteroidales bacterium]
MSISIYHICNKSSRRLFRTKEDYNMAINRIAAASNATEAEILAFAIMSTHFHILLRTKDIHKFIKYYTNSYSKTFNNKYQNTENLFNVGITNIKTNTEIINCADYIHQNPIHHNVCSTALFYPFSTANSYFNEEFIRDEYHESEKVSPNIKSPSKYSIKEKKKMFGYDKVPAKWEILNNCLVLPSSFIEISTLTKLYRNVRFYLEHLNKPLSDEIKYILVKDYKSTDLKNSSESFKKKTYAEYYYYDEHVIKSNRVTDIYICTFIERFINYYNLQKSFIYLSQKEKDAIWNILRKRGIDRYQFLRCVNF